MRRCLSGLLDLDLQLVNYDVRVLPLFAVLVRCTYQTRTPTLDPLNTPVFPLHMPLYRFVEAHCRSFAVQ
jgi:hypothetical protein